MTGQRHCLILDDSRMVRRVAARIVKEMGFVPVEAETADAAIGECRINMPSVILLDWNVGGDSGVDFLAKLRTLKGGDEPQIVFCTAERRVERIIEALSAGADEYIMKPFDSDIIHAKFAMLNLVEPCAAL